MLSLIAIFTDQIKTEITRVVKIVLKDVWDPSPLNEGMNNARFLARSVAKRQMESSGWKLHDHWIRK